MKRNRILILMTALALMVALAAMAQAPGRMGGRGNRGPVQAAGEGRLGGPQFLVKFLELTEAQIAQFRTFQEQARAESAPLAEMRRANAEKIREALEGGAPDATEIGEIMIANHKIGGQIRAIHEAAQAKLVAILDPAQKEKYEKFLEFRNAMPRRGLGGQGFGAGHGGGMGAGNGFGAGDGTCPWCED